jgi:hypothetical protein
MKAPRLILMICLLAPLGCLSSDFWFIGALPASQATYTGEARFKLALHSAIDKQPVSRSDSLGSQTLRVVNGRFVAKLKTPAGKEDDFVLKTEFSEDGKSFVSLPDVRLILVHLHLDKGTQGRLLGPTVVDPCEDKSDLPIIAGQKYTFCMQRRSASADTVHLKSGLFDFNDGVSLFNGPSVLTAASLTIRENETKYWAARAPMEVVAGGKPALGPEKAVMTPPSLQLRQVSADQYGTERNWTDTQGRQLRATFISADSTHIVVRVPAGMLQILSLNQLSQSDQDYARRAGEP